MKQSFAVRASAALLCTAAAATGTASFAHAAPQGDQNPAAAPSSTPNWTKGTRVTLRNDTGHTVWVSRYIAGTKWTNPSPLTAGRSDSFAGEHTGSDDVELRIYRLSPGQPHFWEPKNRIEVDAENPNYSMPWLSVDWDSEYFNVNATHWWNTSDGPKFWGKRDADSSNFKEFQLHMKAGW